MEMRSDRIDLNKVYKRRDRYDIPDWQREKVWNKDQQRRLIDSILRGWKLPKFYFQRTSTNPDTFDVVDGQQRLNAIWGFMSNEIELSSEAAAEFGARTYKDLSDAQSDAFDDYEIEYDVIITASDDEVKEFFQRLQAGLPLTTSEKLNSIHSKLRDFCSRQSKHPFFTECTTVANRRFEHFDICAKVLTLEIEGIDSGTRFDDIAKMFNDNASFSSSSGVARRVRSVLNLLRESFPAESKALRQRSMVQSVMTLACHLKRAGFSDAELKKLGPFIERFSSERLRQVELGNSADDPDYIAFQKTVNANVKSGASRRHEILLKKLFIDYPEFYSNDLVTKEIGNSIHRAVESTAFSVRKLITAINELHAASSGGDLFKPTNKTVSALGSIGKILNSPESYQSWIDDLYFIFRESVGQRLDGEIPSSFSDVNNLRTLLHHDLDHGKSASSRRKKLAGSLIKYAGVPSFDAIAPGALPLVQVNLLKGLEKDLKEILADLSS
ncbi:DUF262 domain-containing protein [Saccharomonospora piscinae]|uniref:GmrSD restriction endonuclease domain-containing protein n=1 Tax=Saccharomonospora piscinae TaxID=687388 RepID=UPI001105AEE8|nr:DUF262 domain-containing protein [Saccharomonospora piscinae]TLW93161.1 DUF262 domain-containing protein [Saccharomonospora piscinae]